MAGGIEAAISRKGRPTAEDAQQKLEVILDAARTLFCDLGYRAVTMRMVAEKADVSPRTLYYQYSDKLSLFKACIDIGATEFPKLDPNAKDIAKVLSAYAATLVHMLSSNTSMRLGMLVYRDGNEFPELIKAAEANHIQNLLLPISAYLRQKGLERNNEKDAAQLFISMALSEWQKRVSFKLELSNAREIERHAAFITRVFLNGAKRGSLKSSR